MPSGPDIDVPLVRQVALAPSLVLVLPAGDQPRNRGGREPGAVGPEQGLEGLREVARAHTLEVQPGDQLLDALGLAQVRREDLAGEPLSVAGGPPVVHPRHGDGQLPYAGQNRPGIGVAVANDSPATLGIGDRRAGVDLRRGFVLHRLDQQSQGPTAQNLGKRVLGDCR